MRAGIAAIAAAVALLLTAAAPADTQPPPAAPADTQPSPAAPPPSSSPTPAPPALTLDPLPTGLVTLLPLSVSGTAAPGALVHVSGGAASTTSTRCDARAGADGRWSCSVASLPDGPGVVIRAVPGAGGDDATGRVDVLSPPTLTAGDGPQRETAGGVRGLAYPGATVTVRADTGSSCSFPADSRGVWGCVLSRPLASGRHTITASQIAPFSTERSRSTAPLAIIVDTAAPAAPRITAPASSAMTPGKLTVAGTGESGGTVTVYASDSRTSAVVCTAVVTGTAWSCAGTLPAGRFLVSALQRDAAGNVSAGSNSIALTVAAPVPTTSVGPSGSPTAAPAAPSAAPAPVAPAAPPETTPTPPPATADGSAPTAVTPDWMRTPFSSASAPVVTADAIPGWLRSVLLAIAAVLLLALPARLLAGTMARSRAEHPRAAWSVFGRNRSTADRARSEPPADSTGSPEAAAPRRNPWLIPAGLAAAAALVTLSSPVSDPGAYLRVVLAIVLALAVVNGVWVVVAQWLAPLLGAGRATLVFRPAMLIVVAAAAIGSRIFELQPALVCGLVVGVRLAVRIGRVPRGRMAAAQIAALAALGVSAWSLIGVLPQPAGAVSAFLTETVDALALLSLGSAAVALLPIGGLAGRAVFQWSRLVWLGLGLVVYTLLFALLLPVASLIRTGQSTLVLVIGALGFAAVSVCLWLWERYVEPSR